MSLLPEFLWLQSLKSMINCSPLTVEPETLVSDVIAKMAESGTGIVVVGNSQVSGWLSAQQMLKLVALGIDGKNTLISTVMRPATEITIKLSEFVNFTTVFARLHHNQFTCLVVVDEQAQLIGTVTPESILSVLKLSDSSLLTVQTPLSKSEFFNLRETRFATDSISPQGSWGKGSKYCYSENNNRSQLALEKIQTIYWEWNLHNQQINFLHTAEAGSEMEAMGILTFSEVLNLVHPDDRETVERANKSAIAQNGSFAIAHRLIIPGDISTYKWVLARGTVLTDMTGQPTRMIGVTTEIGDQARNQVLALPQQDDRLPTQQTALAQGEARFRNLVEASSDLIWEVDENIKYTYVSPTFRDILGYEPEELLGKTPFDLMPPPEVERISQIFAAIAANQQPFKCLENINQHKDGHLVILESSGVPVFNAEGKFCGYRGMDRDITTRKQAQDKLWETQERLKAILDNSPAVIYVLDPQNRYLLLNQQGEKLLQTSQAEIIGKSIYDVWPSETADRFAQNHHWVLRNGEPLEIEENLQLTDGLHTYISIQFPLKDSHGGVYAVCGISTDITDRKQAEAKLRQSEEYLRLLIESIKDYAIYMLDTQGRVMTWNSGAECLTGYQTREIIGRNFACFFPQLEIAQALPQRQLEQAVAQGRCECESIFVRKDSSTFWAHCVITPLYDADRNLRGFSKITHDITDRKLAEESLLRFQKAIASTSDAVIIGDVMDESIYVNQAFTDLYGYSLAELQAVGGTWAIFQASSHRYPILNAILNGDSWRGEVTMRSRTGQMLQVYLRADAIKDAQGNIVGTVCIHTNITQRQQAEEGLRLRDRAIAASSNGIIIADASIPNKPIIYVNPAFEQMTGYLSEDVIGQNFRLFYKTDINQAGWQELNAAMQAGKACTVILCNYRKDGSLFWSELNISPVYDQTNSLTHYIGIQTDITERQKAATELLVSQQRLQYLLASSPAIIYTSRIGGDFGAVFVSDNVNILLGYESREITQNSHFWISHIHPEDQPRVLAILNEVLEQKQHKLEYRFLHQDGTYRWLYDQGRVVWDEADNPVEIVGCITDITDRKQLEEELKIALEKEKELSELKSRFVSMTSHEFRTPLSIILSSSELLEHYHHKLTPEKQRTHLSRIQSAVKRMTEMLDDVLIIGKAEVGKLEFVPQLFDLAAYCRNLVAETQASLSHQQIHFTSEHKTIECCMDDKLLGHILGNLLSNAVKYSPANGNIKLMLKSLNGKAIFEIQDEGIGIPPEDIPHLFESFHRASNVGNILGTGLGLAIVKKCVDIHQGEISVHSKLGVGTVFTVNLPLNN